MVAAESTFGTDTAVAAAAARVAELGLGPAATIVCLGDPSVAVVNGDTRGLTYLGCFPDR